jgi:hypothetical protein
MVLMRVFNAIVRLIGGSPVGKPVLLRIDDASEATLNSHQFAGRLVALNQDGTAVIELETPLVLGDGTIDRVVAVPRHQGYGFDRLSWGFITVNLLGQTGNPFAIASLKVGKLARSSA